MKAKDAAKAILNGISVRASDMPEKDYLYMKDFDNGQWVYTIACHIDKYSMETMCYFPHAPKASEELLIYLEKAHPDAEWSKYER